MMERITAALEGLRSYWENITPRERLFLGVLGGVLAVLLIGLPVYLFSASISDLEEDNERITTALRQISRSRGRIAAMRATQAERDARYAMGTPGEDWLSAQVSRHQLALSRVQDEPERQVGRFRVHTTRAQFQGVGLRPTVLLMTELKNSRYAVAIERIHIDHHSTGDRYNVEVGVQTFERPGGAAPGVDAGVPRAAPRPGGRTTAGPPPR